MASWVDILDKHGDSYLSWARSKDVEVYKDAKDAGLLRQGSGRPHAFEVDLNTQLSMAVLHELKKLTHVYYGRGKKFQDKGWPTPETASEIVKRFEAEQGYDDLMSEIVFVEQDEFDAHIAAHASGDVVRVERE